jgi:hypothetical protein
MKPKRKKTVKKPRQSVEEKISIIVNERLENAFKYRLDALEARLEIQQRERDLIQKRNPVGYVLVGRTSEDIPVIWGETRYPDKDDRGRAEFRQQFYTPLKDVQIMAFGNSELLDCYVGNRICNPSLGRAKICYIGSIDISENFTVRVQEVS